jgi:hypothetical protein
LFLFKPQIQIIMNNEYFDSTKKVYSYYGGLCQIYETGYPDNKVYVMNINTGEEGFVKESELTELE